MIKNLYIIFLLLFTNFGFGQVLDKPTANYAPGTYLSNINVALNHTEPGVTIFYTLNGNEPTPSDYVYSGPINLGSRVGEPNNYSMIPTNPSLTYPYGTYTTSRANNRGWLPPYSEVFKINILRFKAFKPGFAPSETVTHTYIIDTEGTGLYSFPILSFVIDSLDMFSDETGIYVYGDHPDGNYSNKGALWERIAHFEYFKMDGTLGYAQTTRTRMHGGGSRHSAKKNLRLYGETNEFTNFRYPFFDNIELDKFKRLLIRAGGHRPDCFPRDDLANYFTQGLNADQQHYKYVILFINGEYWGIHALRERVDKYFIQNQFGIDDNDVTILDQEYDVQDGHASDSLEMKLLENFVSINNMSLSSNYAYAENRMDIDNYIDYMCSEIFLSNEDWVYSNVVIWRKTGAYDPTKPKGQDGKFRWIFYDLDGAFGGSCDNAYYTVNTLENATIESGLYSSYTRLFRGLLDNEEFRLKFIRRMSDLTNSWFKSNTTTEKLTATYDLLTPEMMPTIERWRYPSVATTIVDRNTEIPSFTQWNETFNLLDRFLRRRGAKVHEHMMEKWGYTDTSYIQVDVNNSAMGQVKINSLLINPQLPGVEAGIYPWQGRYINNIEHQLVAIPLPGYEFVEWQETGSTNDTISINLIGDTSLTAIFQLSNDYAPVVINEVMPSNDANLADNFGDYDDWLELYNPNTYPINLSNCTIERDGIIFTIASGTYIAPNGFYLFWHDSETYQGENHVNFKLPNSSNSVILRDPSGIVMDEFIYPNTPTDNSYGRFPNGSPTFASFTFPTPLRTNNLASDQTYNLDPLQAFPNPSNTIIHLNKKCDFQIFNLSGELIQTNNKGNKIDVSNYPSGIYILRNEFNETIKLIVP